jgi:spore coat polysaccharide biosynthesis protein SpsF (cytidylyltransferase family)
MNPMPSVTLVIQARMGSTRLPGKMLLPLHQNKSLLHWLLARIKSSKMVEHIVVATSNLAEDHAIVEACKNEGISCTVGSDWDVLSRFYQAASSFPSDIVVRVCGDSPLINGEIIDFVVEQLISRNVDYFSNGNEPPRYAEDGFCAEAFYFKDLKEAFEKAEWMSEREHVTPYIKKNKNLLHSWQQFSSEYHYKLSIDTQEDFRQVQWIFSKLSKPETDGMREILKVIRRPDSIVSNANKLNEGYQKSLIEDQKVGRTKSK